MRLIDADLLMRKCEKWLKPKAPDEDEMVSLEILRYPCLWK